MAPVPPWAPITTLGLYFVLPHLLTHIHISGFFGFFFKIHFTLQCVGDEPRGSGAHLQLLMGFQSKEVLVIVIPPPVGHLHPFPDTSWFSETPSVFSSTLRINTQAGKCFLLPLQSVTFH